VFLGKVRNYYGKLGVAELMIETGEELNLGDEVVFLGSTTGVVEQFVEEIREELEPVKKVVKGQIFSIKTKDIVRRGDKLYKLVNTEDLKKKKRALKK